MLNLLNTLLRKLMIDPVTGLAAANVRFQPPDAHWRLYVNNLQGLALNIYLVELRENRKLRSNERVRTIEKGVVSEEPAPARLDCHYLISAWSPAEDSIQVEPTLDEQALLYDVAAVLLQQASLNPSRIYPANSVDLNAWPERFRQVEMPVVVAPVDGFPKLAEFWGTMGQGHRWKPVIYLIVTVPVELVREVAGPMVTTLITEHGVTASQEAGEVWIQIGGQVLAGATSLVGVWVGIEEMDTGALLHTTETDKQGRFIFGNLQSGRYRLRARTTGPGELIPPRVVDVPSPTGEYDLHFT